MSFHLFKVQKQAKLNHGVHVCILTHENGEPKSRTGGFWDIDKRWFLLPWC